MAGRIVGQPGRCDDAVVRDVPDLVVRDVRVVAERAFPDTTDPDPRPPPRSRAGIAGGLVALAIAGVIPVIAVHRPQASRPSAVRSPAPGRQAGVAGVAAAYGEPARCLVVTVAPHFPTWARADFNRARACGRYTGDPTAIFERTAGAWRPIIEAATYTCPVAGMPPGAQLELGVCAAAGPLPPRPRAAPSAAH